MKIVLTILGNAAGLLAAGYFVPGFYVTHDVRQLALLAVALTIMNAFLRPVLKLLLGPVIVLTLGLGTIFVNAGILALLDFLAPSLNIQGIVALGEGTLILALINFAIYLLIPS